VSLDVRGLRQRLDDSGSLLAVAMTTHRERYAQVVATLPKPHQEAMRYHLDAQRQVGAIARMVVQHPGWQVFLDHLDAHLEVLTKRLATLRDRIVTGVELGDALAALKLESRDLSGEVRGLTLAKQLVPQMIEAGDKAVDALAGLDASMQNGATR
jgi:hypothetical protein